MWTHILDVSPLKQRLCVLNVPPLRVVRHSGQGVSHPSGECLSRAVYLSVFLSLSVSLSLSLLLYSSFV